MSEARVQDCPWCGSDVEIRIRYGTETYYIKCLNPRCLAPGPEKKTEDEAVEVWNRIQLKDVKVEPQNCPLCGAGVVQTLIDGLYVVWCPSKCALRGPAGKSSIAAVKGWNRLTVKSDTP